MRFHTRSVAYGVSLALLSVMGCASMVNYHFYGLELPAECYAKGALLGKLGHNGWPDLPFAECQPDTAIKGKCTIELSADHFAKDLALRQCQADLNTCQGRQ